MSFPRVSCQENLLPGRTDLDRWLFAQDAGYVSVELRGRENGQLLSRLRTLEAAAAQGATYNTVCVDMPYFIGAFNSPDRKRAVHELKQQLTAIAALGGVGVVTPAAFGLFSRCLPPHRPPRSTEDDAKVLLESLSELDEYASDLGVWLLLEPLNRYEDHLVNTLDAARFYTDQLENQSVRIVADSFHMNIEETDVAASLRINRDVLGHVQISDSNRAIPGHGHFDWTQFLQGLQDIDYTGELALECLEHPTDHARAIAEVPGFLDQLYMEGVCHDQNNRPQSK